MRTCTFQTPSHSGLARLQRNLDRSIHGSQEHRFITTLPSTLSKSSGLSVRCAVRFRPCIDIHKGKVKQIVGSTLRDSKDEGSTLVTNFESDKSAAEYANLYKEDGLAGGHVIMLGADPLSKSASFDALHAYPGGLQVGGGINSDNALSYIQEGASHVIVTSYVFNNGQMDLDRLKDLVGVVGKQRLILDLSCRKKISSPGFHNSSLNPMQEGKYAIVTDRWQKFSDVYLDQKVLEFLASYADEFLVHGVDVEGKKLGIDEELVALLGRYSPVGFGFCICDFVIISHIPVTYAGGVTVMADLERIKDAGNGNVDVTVGSALDIFGGNLAYKDVVAWHTQQQALMV
ncbi:1-(5-phosphoribosyl)-5- (5-phosphoribosylamino)methylideneamino [Tripterygium wilfordii]|uniref:1-(5-phosphoribosyl)-5-[(5-phosphoribosylamino)methylideneamino] imidazole-4-carboxamide isomerase HISN3, chloroplastic n=1 Tax=Tripterygium wilfordii TaxID=458696 RepID=A0A7J7DW31_TRIWF|nr:1-(5-phosphoribosyl)-5- (5-phosphoribosylamino)methylideneamino [Tripterygium wilfordii]